MQKPIAVMLTVVAVVTVGAVAARLLIKPASIVVPQVAGQGLSDAEQAMSAAYLNCVGVQASDLPGWFINDGRGQMFELCSHTGEKGTWSKTRTDVVFSVANGIVEQEETQTQ